MNKALIVLLALLLLPAMSLAQTCPEGVYPCDASVNFQNPEAVSSIIIDVSNETVNASDFWLTNEGTMDNVVDLYAYLVPYSGATGNVDLNGKAIDNSTRLNATNVYGKVLYAETIQSSNDSNYQVLYSDSEVAGTTPAWLFLPSLHILEVSGSENSKLFFGNDQEFALFKNDTGFQIDMHNNGNSYNDTYLWGGLYISGNISTDWVNANNINVTGNSYLGSMTLEGGNITADNVNSTTMIYGKKGYIERLFIGNYSDDLTDDVYVDIYIDPSDYSAHFGAKTGVGFPENLYLDYNNVLSSSMQVGSTTDYCLLSINGLRFIGDASFSVGDNYVYKLNDVGTTKGLFLNNTDVNDLKHEFRNSTNNPTVTVHSDIGSIDAGRIGLGGLASSGSNIIDLGVKNGNKSLFITGTKVVSSYSGTPNNPGEYVVHINPGYTLGTPSNNVFMSGGGGQVTWNHGGGNTDNDKTIGVAGVVYESRLTEVGGTCTPGRNHSIIGGVFSSYGNTYVGSCGSNLDYIGGYFTNTLTTGSGSKDVVGWLSDQDNIITSNKKIYLEGSYNFGTTGLTLGDTYLFFNSSENEIQFFVNGVNSFFINESGGFNR